VSALQDMAAWFVLFALAIGAVFTVAMGRLEIQ
jgi:hypothetical protein